MKRRPRIRYSEADKALMWDRWQKGDSMHDIARLFDRYHSSVQRILSENGGVRPLPRKRSRLSLTLSEREEISRGVVTGCSLRSIAELLGRSPSTVSRRSIVMEVVDVTVPIEQTKRLGNGHIDRSVVDWLRTLHGSLGGKKAAAALVTGADRRLVETHVPGRRELPGVTRDHLSQPVHPSPGRLEKGAPWVSATAAHDAAIASYQSEGSGAGEDPRYGIDPRAPSIGGRSSRAGARLVPDIDTSSFSW